MGDTVRPNHREDFERYQKNWETNARVDSMWSVLSERDGLKLLKKAYINWDLFYLNQTFVLTDTHPVVDSHYPQTPLYFFSKS